MRFLFNFVFSYETFFFMVITYLMIDQSDIDFAKGLAIALCFFLLEISRYFKGEEDGQSYMMSELVRSAQKAADYDNYKFEITDEGE